MNLMYLTYAGMIFIMLAWIFQVVALSESKPKKKKAKGKKKKK